jgi:DNA-binding MarR family transcriptional regulator
MSPTRSESGVPQRGQLHGEVARALREVILQLTLFNRYVAGNLDLKDVDHACLNLIERHGPLSLRDLASRAGLHPATATGALDRLERGQWVVRERDPSDRRADLVRPLRQRTGELMRLYAPMNKSMNRICAGYNEDELGRLAEFLHLVAVGARDANENFAADGQVKEPVGDGLIPCLPMCGFDLGAALGTSTTARNCIPAGLGPCRGLPLGSSLLLSEFDEGMNVWAPR